MIKILTFSQEAEAQFVRSLLRTEGVAAEIRGEAQPEVWIPEDPQTQRVLERLAKYPLEAGLYALF